MKHQKQIEVEKIITDFIHLTADIFGSIWESSVAGANQSEGRAAKKTNRLVEFVRSQPEKIAAVLSEPKWTASMLDQAIVRIAETIYQKNQFLNLTGQDEMELRQLVAGYWHELQILLAKKNRAAALEQEIEAVVRNFIKKLSATVPRLRNNFNLQSANGAALANQIICCEYSPQLQLAVLGVAPEDLTEPILDIGCGKHGQLVNFLRQLGQQAFGCDRVVAESEFFFKADWMDLTFPENSWGTIISHMAFSNHFIFHHLNKIGSPEEYARQYLNLLNSLKPGGCFYYSPGVKFFERYLPAEKFLLKRIAVDVETEKFAPLLQLLDEDGFYSSQVTKF